LIRLVACRVDEILQIVENFGPSGHRTVKVSGRVKDFCLFFENAELQAGN
jgi:hypothetical protein